VDRVSTERMCAGKEFQVKGAGTEKARSVPGIHSKNVLSENAFQRFFNCPERTENRDCNGKLTWTKIINVKRL